MNQIQTVTIVIPTRNEADNIEPLIAEIMKYVPTGTHLIFIDDSTDDRTVQTMQEVRQNVDPASLVIEIVHRPEGERTNGLAGAVTYGISIATTDLVLVMDGDLQHPPETIQHMLEKAVLFDVVVASRYCPGGSATGLGSPIRHAVSRLSTWIAKLMFPRALRGITDPMTGFFVVQRERTDTARLQTAGFKILLEILIRHPDFTRTEVPLCFAARTSGESKGTVAQGLFYLRQLLQLRFSKAL